MRLESSLMQVGMTLPVMEPDLDRSTLEAWVRAVDEGPYSSLCFGERVAFDNPETLTLLGACAAWTRRVRLTVTVVVPQLHDPVALAKALATADVLCEGRLSVGFGVGGRDEDYRAVQAPLKSRTMAEMAERVDLLRRIWVGERVRDLPRRVGPPPVRPGGPELLVGTLGPRTVRSAAAWADGLAGISLDADPDGVRPLFEQVRAAWAERGRPAPRLTTSFWYAVHDDVAQARAQVDAHLRHYFTWLPADLVEAMLPGTGFAGTDVQLRALLDRFAATGADEVHLIPTSADPAQVARVAALL